MFTGQVDNFPETTNIYGAKNDNGKTTGKHAEPLDHICCYGSFQTALKLKQDWHLKITDDFNCIKNMKSHIL